MGREQGEPGSGLTRRRLLGTAAAGAAVAAVPSGAQAKPRPSPSATSADVVVVGGGLAGLAAAREIVKAGRSAVVLEARPRVGGRIVNHAIGGGEISELGGEYTGPTQNHIQALAGEVGVDTFPTYNTGENVYFFDGQRSTWSDTGPTGSAPLDPVVLADLATVVARLDDMSTHVPVNAPWTSESAADWDQQTLETWLRENSATPRFRELAAVATRAIFGAEPRDLSLLFVLFYIAASGDEDHPGTFERNFNTSGGAQERRFVGGSALIAEKVAAALGGAVQLGRPVRRIAQTGSGVTVDADGLTVTGKRAIVALAPTLAGRIRFEPDLPELRDGLHQRVPMGTLLKCEAVYDRPFWRDDGLTGFAVADTGPCNVTFENSPPDGSPGILFGFIGGDEAREWGPKPAGERKAAVLKNFADYFGDRALHPTDYFEGLWSQETWTRGGPVGVLQPGSLLEYGPALREPAGRVHWAGTETSTYWNGYMDGAVRSGKRAAQEALAEL